MFNILSLFGTDCYEHPFVIVQVTKNMGSVVKGLDKALASMDLQKVGITELMYITNVNCKNLF